MLAVSAPPRKALSQSCRLPAPSEPGAAASPLTCQEPVQLALDLLGDAEVVGAPELVELLGSLELALAMAKVVQRGHRADVLAGGRGALVGGDPPRRVHQQLQILHPGRQIRV